MSVDLIAHQTLALFKNILKSINQLLINLLA
jgi:hypothetical protein